MKTISYLLGLILFLACAEQTQAQNYAWAKSIGYTGGYGHGVAVDASGNVYTTGVMYFSGQNGNIFISKHDASGNLLWTKTMGSTGEDSGNSIAVDASGNAYATGYFEGTVDFDPNAGTFNLTSAGQKDIFIVKLDTSGNLVWAKRMGSNAGSATHADQGYGIAVDASGNVHTTGYFSGTVDFDPNAGTFNLTSNPSMKAMFITKLDTSGNLVWAKHMAGEIKGYGITVDASGNVHTTGSILGTVDFDPNAGTFNLTNDGANWRFVSKLDASGNFVWAKIAGGVGYSIAVDASGNVYTTGRFSGTVDFDPGVGIFNLNSMDTQQSDMFVSKLDVSGNFVWAKHAWANGSVEGGEGIAVDTSGNVYVTGGFGGTPTYFGPFSLYCLAIGYNPNMFISKLDTLGNFEWVKRIGGSGSTVGYGIAVDASGNIYTTGSFGDTVDFDPNIGVVNLVSSSGNAFVSKLSPLPAPQTITFGALAERTFGSPFNLTATTSSGLSPTYTSSNTAVATVSGNTVTMVGLGSTTITASAGNANYATVSAQQTLVINKGSQSIYFDYLMNREVGGEPFMLQAYVNSGLAITYQSSNPAVATVSGNIVTIVGIGTTNITASQAGNANYYPATDVIQTFTVVKANQYIGFEFLPTKTFGDAPFNLTASTTSNLALSYSSSNTAVATISGNTVTIVGVGSTTITASQAGNTNYNPANDITRTLTVNKANQTLTFDALPAKTFGDAPFALTGSASSSLPVSYTSSNTSVATISGNTITIVGVGSTTITASQAGNTNYNSATNVAQTLTVGKANQTITFNTLPTKNFGDAPFALSASASSSLPVSYTSSNTSVATISGNTITIVGVGTANITASQAGNVNYNSATDVTQMLTVGKGNQTLTFPTITDKVYGESPFALNATTSSGLAVSYSITTTPATGVATLSGNTITIVGLGSVSVTASQAGNTNYNPATNVVRTFNIVYPTSALPTISVSEISIYPNPSKSGFFEVSGLQSVDKQQVSYQVIDASGKAVLRGVWVGKDRETLNLQTAVSGSYTLVLQGSKNQTTKKLVKQ